MSMMNHTDRLSSLSDSVLHHIFSFLNIKSVIQTCVLSKRWKTLWIHIPTLNFDFDSYPIEGLTYNGFDTKYSSIKRFIFRVFSEHRCKPIKKLTFSSSIHTDEAGLVVELLYSYARHTQVQELCIDTFNALYFDCPSDLLEFSSLAVLKITTCFVSEWEQLIFCRFRILEVRFDWRDWDRAAIFKKMKVSWNCDNLESLVLVDCVFGSFDLTAPKLENFVFHASSDWEFSFPELTLLAPKLKSVELCNVLPTLNSDSDFSCIHDVKICVDNFEFDGNDSATQNCQVFSQLLKKFHNAKYFALPLKAMEVLWSIPPSLSRFSFLNLRHLKLRTKATNYMISFPITTLMSSLNCPNLEFLEVDFNQGVSALYEMNQKLAFLLEEMNRRYQEDILRLQKREEDFAKLEKLHAIVFNLKEGSQGES